MDSASIVGGIVPHDFPANSAFGVADDNKRAVRNPVAISIGKRLHVCFRLIKSMFREAGLALLRILFGFHLLRAGSLYGRREGYCGNVGPGPIRMQGVGGRVIQQHHAAVPQHDSAGVTAVA